VTRFRRRTAPAFWAAKEAQWATRAAEWAAIDPLAWEHDRRPLRVWFHELCRAESEPPLCAYCDGSLKEQARETIDHVAPRSVFPALALAWHNLLPACDRCNETNKRDQWSCRLVRPDIDPVDDWFDLDMQTGMLRPSDELDATTRARVRLTIRVFRLNDSHRCSSRARLIRDMHNAWKRDARTLERDHITVEERATRGPYRFVVRRFLDAVPVSTRDATTTAR
jgi:uncharacterized protein (TIGR02646 family)